jgi:hypothetical protein
MNLSHLLTLLITGLWCSVVERNHDKTSFFYYPRYSSNTMPRGRVKKHKKSIEIRGIVVDYSVDPTKATSGQHPELTDQELKNFERITNDLVTWNAATGLFAQL